MASVMLRLLALAACLDLAEASMWRRRPPGGRPAAAAAQDPPPSASPLAWSAQPPRRLVGLAAGVVGGGWGHGLKAVGQRVAGGDDPYWEHINNTRKAWEKKQEEVLNGTKPLLRSVNLMRAKMCWTRDDFWNHEKCIKFLGVMCSRASTGIGICTRFVNGASRRCDKPDTRLEKNYCPWLDKMRLIQENREDENEEEEEVAEEAVQKEDLPDMDKDGIPDEDDPDRDNDGVANEKDAFPNSTDEWNDMDGDGIGDNADEDRDGDGHPNEKDAFPNDPKEWRDLDEDGIPDGTDPDIDGDGVDNEEDVDPRDPARGRDRDGDGVEDKDDAFPDDPVEHKDSDGDGYGDFSDEYPDDPNCWKSPCVDKNDVANAMNKVERGLPPDGYDEHTPGLVEHNDMETSTDDWRREWPRSKESRHETIQRLCAEEPDNTWCRRFGYS